MNKQNEMIRRLGRAFIAVIAMVFVGLAVTGCASGGKVSPVPLDRSLESLKMLEPNDEEKAGVPFSILESNPVCDLNFSFPGVANTYGTEYKGVTKAGEIYSGIYMCYGGVLSNVAMMYAKKAAVPDIKKIPPTMAGINAKINTLIAEACPDRTIKQGDKWSTSFKQVKKMDIITGQAFIGLGSQDFEVLGFAEVQGSRCAILKVALNYFMSNFYSANFSIGSGAGAGTASGIYAWDYQNKKIVAVLLDGRVNSYRDGAIANPVKFLQTEKFASEIKTLSNVSEIATIMSSFNSSIGYTILAVVALPTVNNKIIPAFESLPAQVYGALVESALDSSVYPTQAEPAVSYSMTYFAK